MGKGRGETSVPDVLALDGSMGSVRVEEGAFVLSGLVSVSFHLAFRIHSVFLYHISFPSQLLLLRPRLGLVLVLDPLPPWFASFSTLTTVFLFPSIRSLLCDELVVHLSRQHEPDLRHPLRSPSINISSQTQQLRTSPYEWL